VVRGPPSSLPDRPFPADLLSYNPQLYIAVHVSVTLQAHS
jgi:hypothetical protein